MTPDPRLLVQATAELLDGWCGPVVVDGMLSIANDCEVFHPDRKTWWYFSNWTVNLDLSRAECRDQIDRAIVAALGMPPGMKPEFTADEDGWSMLVGDLRDPADGQMAVWDRDGRAAGCCKVDAPGLAGIDPLDRTLLPDGSRLVDALARAAIWMAAGVDR